MKNAVIFGGTGFIGTFFANHLINNERYEKVYLYDYERVDAKDSIYRKKLIEENNKIIQVVGDVRNEIDWLPNCKIDLVANMAAIHREPGHKNFEYFETNILGANNVCNWAEKQGCTNMIFTSSIAPYGPSEIEKNEDSIPVPETAYGSSKLVAEKIHEKWQQKDSNNKLIIVRPGVVFGPGEGGNVSRLIKAVKNRYFLYMGNRDTRKAGIYIKELCLAMTWTLDYLDECSNNYVLFNMSMNPGPSIEEYVGSILKTINKTYMFLNVPSSLLLICAHIIDFFAKPFRIEHPFSPIRIKKLMRSNNIVPNFLVNNGYKFTFTLDDAMKDWKKDSPEDWI